MGLFKLLQLIFWAVLIYLAYKAIKQVFLSKPPDSQIKGKQKTKPLDIDESQIEDADFEELDDK